MSHAYSMDLRWRIVRALEKPGTTYESVAEQFSVGRATVNRIWRRYRETGDVAPKPERGRPPRILDADGEAALLDIVREHPDMTLPELADEVGNVLGVSISRATVGRVLHRHGITRKKSLSSRRSSFSRGS